MTAGFCEIFNHSLEVFTIVDDKHNDDRAASKLLVEMCGKKDELSAEHLIGKSLDLIR
jgi:hypothetical protein